MNDNRISRLTDSQRIYLRLVLAHRSSKEIAHEYNISAHTVDKRIKEAMRVLGVSTRIEAARLLSDAEKADTDRRLGAQSPDLASSADCRPDITLELEGTDRRVFSTHDDGPMQAVRLQDGNGLPLPLTVFARSPDRLSIWQRAGWMIALIIGLALSTGILLSGLMAISALLNSARH